MLIFLDTEFTDLDQPKLISLALVTADGREFYVERNDFWEQDCSDFVQENVLPFLNQVPEAACNRAELSRRLCAWFDSLHEPATLVFDFTGDWLLLLQACGGGKPPSNIADKLHLDNHTICHPIFEKAQNAVYDQDQTLPAHHALADARALKAGYEALVAFMAPIRRIK